MNVLDLFSGIGGFSLGLERARMRTKAFCEINPFCRAVLAKHWPAVPCYDDVRTLTADRLRADGIIPDLICGGFPCQDISIAGNGAGLKGDLSGLWSEYARLIGELRPRYVIVENVSALLNRGLGDVLGDLSAFGYDAEWHCIPAAALGAPHRRDRIWIVGYPSCEGKLSQRPLFEIWRWLGDNGEPLADGGSLESKGCNSIPYGHWTVEPDVGRVAYGVSSRVDRLKALGNAVVPQIPEIIGRAIMKFEEENHERTCAKQISEALKAEKTEQA